MAQTLAEARSHNVPPAVFAKFYREIRDLKTEQRAAASAVAHAKKAAKAAGVDLDALRLLEKLADLDDDEAEMRMRHLVLYAKWIELPIGTQGNFFGDPKPPAADAKQEAAEHDEWVAGELGLEAGKQGLSRDDNPHQAGSAQHSAWDQAWKAGYKTWVMSNLKTANEMAANAGVAAAENVVPIDGSNGVVPPAKRRGRPPKVKEQPAPLL